MEKVKRDIHPHAAWIYISQLTQPFISFIRKSRRAERKIRTKKCYLYVSATATTLERKRETDESNLGESLYIRREHRKQKGELERHMDFNLKSVLVIKKMFHRRFFCKS